MSLVLTLKCLIISILTIVDVAEMNCQIRDIEIWGEILNKAFENIEEKSANLAYWKRL